MARFRGLISCVVVLALGCVNTDATEGPGMTATTANDSESGGGSEGPPSCNLAECNDCIEERDECFEPMTSACIGPDECGCVQVAECPPCDPSTCGPWEQCSSANGICLLGCQREF